MTLNGHSYSYINEIIRPALLCRP